MTNPSAEERFNSTGLYVYIRSEPGLWTVGHYDPLGKWIPESDHDTQDGAANRVHWLHGGREHV